MFAVVVFRDRRFHLKDVLDLGWSPDGAYLVSGSVDNTSIIWNVEKGTHPHPHPLTPSFSQRNNYLHFHRRCPVTVSRSSGFLSSEWIGPAIYCVAFTCRYRWASAGRSSALRARCNMGSRWEICGLLERWSNVPNLLNEIPREEKQGERQECAKFLHLPACSLQKGGFGWFFRCDNQRNRWNYSPKAGDLFGLSGFSTRCEPQMLKTPTFENMGAEFLRSDRRVCVDYFSEDFSWRFQEQPQCSWFASEAFPSDCSAGWRASCSVCCCQFLCESPVGLLQVPSSKQYLFYDENMPSFFRRLSWSPDGSFLLIPSGWITTEKRFLCTMKTSRVTSERKDSIFSEYFALDRSYRWWAMSNDMALDHKRRFPLIDRCWETVAWSRCVQRKLCRVQEWFVKVAFPLIFACLPGELPETSYNPFKCSAIVQRIPTS